MAIVQCIKGVQGDPDFFLPALQRAEFASAESDGPQPGSGPRTFPECTQFNRKYVQITALTVFIMKCGICIKAVTTRIYSSSVVTHVVFCLSGDGLLNMCSAFSQTVSVQLVFHRLWELKHFD